MKLLKTVDQARLAQSAILADSNEFAIYDLGEDTYALVQRHESVPWEAVEISGDALFRIAELLAVANRALYRDLAARLSPRVLRAK